MGKCCIAIPMAMWEDILAFGLRNWRSKRFTASLCKLSWSVAVYHLWRLRNAIINMAIIKCLRINCC
jgi:hypothetical protein